MENNDIAKIILSIAAGVALAYVIQKYYLQNQKTVVELQKQQAKEELIKEKIKDCQTTCKSLNNLCNKGCDKLSGSEKEICQLGCKGTNMICEKTCTGKSGLRNGSLHHVNVYDKDMKHLTILRAWEPRSLTVEIEQFPITVTRCFDINMPECPQNDTRFVLKIENPGCYILWGGGSMEFYTTPGACM